MNYPQRRSEEPTCWHCDQSAKRKPLVVKYGVHFHSGECVRAFEAQGWHRQSGPQKRTRRKRGQSKAPLKRRTA